MAVKKLGRGLGALVELPPASDDGTARVGETVRGGAAASVLSLSGRSVEEYFRAASPTPIAPAPNVPLVLPPRAAVAQSPTAPVLAPVEPPVVAATLAAEPPSADEPLVADPCLPATPAPIEEPDAMSPPDDDLSAARAVQYRLFDPPVAADVPAAVAERVESAASSPAVAAARVPETAPAPEVTPAEPEQELIDEPVFLDDVIYAPDTAADTPPDAAPPAPVATAPIAPSSSAEPPARQFVEDDVFLDESVGGIVLPDVELE